VRKILDSESSIFEIGIIFALIIANGLFSMTEMAIVSSRKSRLEKKADEGDKGARVALELAEDPNQMLSTIQIGITLIGILTGTFGGANLAGVLAEQLNAFAFLAPYSYSISLFFVISAITYFTLIIGELVPKRLAMNNPEPIASVMAVPMRTFAKLSLPIVAFLSASTNAVLRFAGIKQTEEPPVTEDEIKILLEQGAEAGTFEKEEPELVDRIFRLADLRAGAVMTPRTQMQWLDLEQPAESLLQIITESSHSRFPVARGSLDNFIGMVYTNDILADHLRGKKLDVEKAIRIPVYIPESMKIMKVLEILKSAVTHEAIVLDEYGGIEGFITLHDILEEILGVMPMGLEEIEESRIIKRDDNSWLVDGLVGIEEFKDHFDIDELPGEDKELFKTVGGFVTYYFGYIPAAAEQFTWDVFQFEILDMDRVRVDKVLVTKKDTDANADFW